MAASIRILKRRIKTARNIAQITRAMEMVAASKMRRAQERTLAGKPYATKLRLLVQNLVGRIDIEEKHPYLMQRGEGLPEGLGLKPRSEGRQGKVLMLVFSSDKGLCGSFNTNLLRMYLRYVGEGREVEVVTIGKKLARPVIRTGGLLVADFLFGTTLPPFETVLPITSLVVDSYMRQDYRSVVALYMQFESLGKQEPVVQTILPIQRDAEIEASTTIVPYFFEPNAAELLTRLFPHYLEMSLYQMFLENYASEQAARMVAMHQASQNAKDVIWELSLTYNKARQERITNELLDITTATMGLGV